MISIRQLLVLASALVFLGPFCSTPGHAQAALLLEEPYGFFGTVNPTGHEAIYFERICAASPVKLRRCEPGELGSVIARYEGIDGYDWVAIPLIPYLYSVDDPADVPDHVDRETVTRLRSLYRETHLQQLGAKLQPGDLFEGGWTQLAGVAYERRIYAFRFDTTPAQDDALIAQLNSGRNATRFNLLFNNCADFARVILNDYFPHSFKRSVFPDAGMTTPKQIAYKLTRYARKHPETQLAVFEIPQVPGYRRQSQPNKSIDESFVTTVYAIPIAILNPYLAGGLFVDYLVRGRYHLIPRNPPLLGPENMSPLTAQGTPEENAPVNTSLADGSSLRGTSAGAEASAASLTVGAATAETINEIQPGLMEMGAHE
jgi:hypothetical protein